MCNAKYSKKMKVYLILVYGVFFLLSIIVDRAISFFLGVSRPIAIVSVGSIYLTIAYIFERFIHQPERKEMQKKEGERGQE